MSYNLGTEKEPIPVFVSFAGGILDLPLRADDYDTFLKTARYVGLYYEVMGIVTDEDTGELRPVATGVYKVAKDVSIDLIGPATITSGVYDDDGKEISPPIIDTRCHANVRMMGSALARTDEHGTPLWEIWAMAWTLGGADDTHQNAAEEGKAMYGVTLIDPATIASPSRVWA